MTPFTITEEKAGAFRVTSARKDDEEEVMDLLVQAAEWLRDKGSNQWSGLLQGKIPTICGRRSPKGMFFIQAE